MSKFKDIIYDISDVIVAFCIVIVACFVIWGSIGNIMDYPAMVAASDQGKNSNFGLAVPVDDSNSTTDGAIDKGNAEKPENSSGDAKPESYAIYINPGESTTSIAQKFVSVGLFDTVEQFNTLLSQNNAASKIKTGNFIIAADATPEEVITQITTTTGQ